MLNDRNIITVFVILWGHMSKPVLKKSMGGGIFIQAFLSEMKCNTIRYTKGNVTIVDKVKTCEQKYR